MDNYQTFLSRKAVVDAADGLRDIGPIHESLFDFQVALVKWALRRGRAAVFADCGLGKTRIQLEWARQIRGRVLILAPLAVAKQTVREGEKLGLTVEYCRDGKSTAQITITNYEMMEHFNPDDFIGIVLDESSILKSFTGSTRNLIIEKFGHLRFRLCCTATPAPNDYVELGNHAEFLGVMSRTEMLSMFFVHDGGETQKWRLKGHAESEFWKWLCSWAVMIRKPSDLGFENNGFHLPPYQIHHVLVDSKSNGEYLFAMEAQTLIERNRARASSVTDRVAAAAKLIKANPGPWLVWCNLNREADELVKLLDSAVNVQGSDSIEDKESGLFGFIDGTYANLISKSSIAGFGLNLQHCCQVAFLGMNDSYEQFYQALRRAWRFGQKNIVQVYIITATSEGASVSNIRRKEADADRMANEMVEHMHDLNTENVRGSQRNISVYNPKTKIQLPSFL